jgi:hypothetical protein
VAVVSADPGGNRLETGSSKSESSLMAATSPVLAVIEVGTFDMRKGMEFHAMVAQSAHGSWFRLRWLQSRSER